jgi:hypothetical protein
MIQANGIFAATYFGPGQPTPIGIHPENGLHPERLQSLFFDFIDDESVPMITTAATYAGEQGTVSVNQITYCTGWVDEEAAIIREGEARQVFVHHDQWDEVTIFTGYSLADFVRAAHHYIEEALGGVPEALLANR